MSSTLCPTQCAPLTLIGLPTSNCATDLRRKTLGRLGMFPCTTELPSPITGAGMKALFDDGTIIATSELANIVPEAPQTEALQISDWRPARDIVTTRTITFEDRLGVAKTSGSPATTDSFFDYSFWLDKLRNYDKIYYLLMYNDGDVVIPTDINGNPLFSSLSGYVDYLRAQQAGGLSTELKKFKLTFVGDPLYFIKPAFNWITAGIEF